MRLRPSICACIMCLSLAYLYPVQAQEGRGQSEIDATISVKSEPDPVLSESESKTSKLPASSAIVKEVQRDSVQVKLTKPFKPAEKVEREEDPLSFNFLYYIIEKFKLSDIIE